MYFEIKNFGHFMLPSFWLRRIVETVVKPSQVTPMTIQHSSRVRVSAAITISHKNSGENECTNTSLYSNTCTSALCYDYVIRDILEYPLQEKFFCPYYGVVFSNYMERMAFRNCSIKFDVCIFADINFHINYTHFGPLWHRYFNLWFEWEMQHMLKSIGHANYHNFRLPYWDWRNEIQNSTVEDPFTEERFWATHNISGFPCLVGYIVGLNGWHTLCSKT